MEQTVFSEKMAGLTIDEVIRDYEFTMQTKHFHDSFELYFLLEGERYYFIDRETYHVKKGMVVLVNRQQIHKTSLAGKSYHDRILLQISQEGFSPLLEQSGLVPLTRMFEENYGVTELPEKVWEQVKRLLFEIREELREKQGKYDEEPMPIPCNMFNCFCMYSDYIPRTLDEWIDYYSLGEDRRK